MPNDRDQHTELTGQQIRDLYNSKVRTFRKHEHPYECKGTEFVDYTSFAKVCGFTTNYRRWYVTRDAFDIYLENPNPEISKVLAEQVIKSAITAYHSASDVERSEGVIFEHDYDKFIVKDDVDNNITVSLTPFDDVA